MLNAFLRSLAAPREVRPPLGGQLAFAALLVRIARIDGHYSAEEVDGIEEILAERFGLGPEAVAELRQKAEVLEAESNDTVRFTRALKDAVPLDDRAGVLEALWSLVLTDGKRDQHEDQMMRLCADLLGINDRDSNLARLRAAEKLA